MTLVRSRDSIIIFVFYFLRCFENMIMSFFSDATDGSQVSKLFYILPRYHIVGFLDCLDSEEVEAARTFNSDPKLVLHFSVADPDSDPHGSALILVG
jgi:hypothetical protein